MTFVKNLFRGNYWLQPIDNSQLVLMRIILGLVIVADAFGGIATGWTYRAFIEPDFTFTFMGFEWLKIFAGKPMYVIYTIFGICGIFITLGAYYRTAAIGAAITWTMIYFAQKTNYNNHYYLLMMLCWILVFLPANRYFSYDAKRNPSIKSLTTPRWTVLIFVVQLLIVYTFASIAKMYPGWIAGEPMEIWFKQKANYPIIGPYLQYFHTHQFVGLGGILFDLLVIPALLWKPTRWLAVVASLGFHLFNSVVFQVGTFPYLMIGTLILFFPPEQIRKTFFKSKPAVNPVPLPETRFSERTQRNKIILIVLSLHFLMQLILPLRHHLYPDSVMWNEEGHRYAWRMMLRAKSGSVTFSIIDNKTGEKHFVRPTEYVTPKQSSSLAIHPDMLWQFVQVIKKDYAKKGMTDISIYARSKIRVNKGKYHTFIDPEYDMAKAKWHYFTHSEWILPEPDDFDY
ncbi:MAG: HTTM domain-containing protein [Saprospiraceae bacterium]